MAMEKGEKNGFSPLGPNNENGTYDKRHDSLPLPVVAKAVGLGKQFMIWTAINMAATIGIVFTNKAIFNDPAFKLMQTSFASFHFVCTGLTLWVVSRPSIGAFTAKRAGIVEMLPVSLLNM